MKGLKTFFWILAIQYLLSVIFCNYLQFVGIPAVGVSAAIMFIVLKTEESLHKSKHTNINLDTQKLDLKMMSLGIGTCILFLCTFWPVVFMGKI